MSSHRAALACQDRQAGDRGTSPTPGDGTIRHDGLLYTSPDELRIAALTFVREGLARGHAVLVGLSPAANAAVAADLGDDAARVEFCGPAASGPGRLVAHRTAFADLAWPAGVSVVTDLAPAGAARATRSEVLLADALLSDALRLTGSPVRLLCALPDDADVRADFAAVHQPGRSGDVARELFARPLPEPTAPVNVYCGNGRPLGALRGFVSAHARAAQVAADRVDDLVLAAHEVATNSLRHAGAEPVVRMWRESDSLVCEIRDRGVIADPMAGRLAPEIDREDGRGLWLAGQLCDLTQVRSSASAGTVVRLVVGLPSRA